MSIQNLERGHYRSYRRPTVDVSPIEDAFLSTL